jgi:hypothetical protein
MTTEAEFLRTYEKMAKEDGGAKYWRVFDEWLDAGRPEPHSEFIRSRTNVSPFSDPDVAEAAKFFEEHVDPVLEDVIEEILQEDEPDENDDVKSE